jgi:hypothetical protein
VPAGTPRRRRRSGDRAAAVPRHPSRPRHHRGPRRRRRDCRLLGRAHDGCRTGRTGRERRRHGTVRR